MQDCATPDFTGTIETVWSQSPSKKPHTGQILKAAHIRLVLLVLKISLTNLIIILLYV